MPGEIAQDQIMTDSVPVVVSNTSSASGLNIHLHPLVILNVSDHHTRGSIQFGSTSVMGALIGTQEGRDIHICNSFELLVAEDPASGGKVVLDKSFFITKQDQYKQIFKTMDVIGWYSTGNAPTPQDIEVHQQIQELNESPLFLKLDAVKTGLPGQELPIRIYESIIEVKDGFSSTAFVKLGYSIETEEAERLAVSHVASATDADAAKGSTLISHLTSQRNAMEMLQVRIQFVLKYVKDIESGNLERDETLIRQIASLCHRLPTMEGTEYHHEMISEFNHAMLIQYLAQMTQSAESLNELVEKQNSLNLHRSGGHSRDFGNRAELVQFRTPRLDS